MRLGPNYYICAVCVIYLSKVKSLTRTPLRIGVDIWKTLSKNTFVLL